MSWIMVQNPSVVPLWGIRMLGLSKKDKRKIGRFGSGLKEAVCLLLRKKVGFVMYCGGTRVDFRIEQRGGVDEVCFRLDSPFDGYDPGIWHGMNLSPDFGHHDWKDMWQAFREIFCNAIDECWADRRFDKSLLHHDVVPEPVGVAGCTRVFIEVDFETMRTYGDLPERLLMLGDREVECETAYGTFYPGKGHVYTKGVWVQEIHKEALFDFDITSLELTESRTTDHWTVRSRIAKMYSAADQAIVGTLLVALREASMNGERSLMELEIHHNSYVAHEDYKRVWQSAWENIFGTKAVACPQETMFYDLLRAKGYTPILFKEEPLEVLRLFDIPFYEKLLSPTEQKGLQAVTHIRSGWFDAIVRELQAKGLLEQSPICKIFKCTQHQKGHCVDGNTVWLDQDIIGSTREQHAILLCLAEISAGDSGAGCVDEILRWNVELLGATQ